MPKRLDDLNLPEDPIASDLAAATQRVDKFVAELIAMEDTPKYHFAWGTIFDIRLTVQKSGRMTEGQRTAITNIKAGVQRREDREDDLPSKRRGGSRRYEGY